MVRDRANPTKFWITFIVNVHRIFFFNISKHFPIFKFALISETVRDRAKQTKLGDHMCIAICQWSQHNYCWFWLHIFESFHSGCIFVQNSIQVTYFCSKFENTRVNFHWNALFLSRGVNLVYLLVDMLGRIGLRKF